jgi:hypothetical protein
MADQIPESGEQSEVAVDLAAAEQAADAPAVAPWVATVFTVGGVAVVPWAVYLALTLPRSSQASHYRLAWVGFDLFLAWVLFRVGRSAARGPESNDRVEIPATAAATLLLVDAWFDVTTSADNSALLAALVLALAAELPLAALCLWIAHHAEIVRERRLRLLPILERLSRR